MSTWSDGCCVMNSNSHTKNIFLWVIALARCALKSLPCFGLQTPGDRPCTLYRDAFLFLVGDGLLSCSDLAGFC